MNFFEELKNFDAEIANACDLELQRQRHNIELIASENIVSKAVLLAAGGVLTNKYAEGYPSKRYYGGCQCVDIVEEIARKELARFLVATLQTFSLTQALTQTLPLSLLLFNPVTPLWV